MINSHLKRDVNHLLGNLVLVHLTSFATLRLGVKPSSASVQWTAMLSPPRLFVSYSHRDQDWLDELRMHLAPLVREAVLDAWDDTRIARGRSGRRRSGPPWRRPRSACCW